MDGERELKEFMQSACLDDDEINFILDAYTHFINGHMIYEMNFKLCKFL